MENIIYNKYVLLVLNHTWGIIMTTIGYIARLVFLVLGIKGRKEGFTKLYKVGKGWGGLSLGTTVIIACDCDYDSIIGHEQGHCIQNALFGILFPLIVAIPSAIRYWYRELKYYRKGKIPKTEYDSIWFEGQASRIGRIYRMYFQ